MNQLKQSDIHVPISYPENRLASVSSRRLLSSWKEIAAYLGKGVRTVQRWEREHMLPVRRPCVNHQIVLAVPDELDAWVLRETKLMGRGNGEGSHQEELAQAREENEELRRQVAYLRELIERLGGKPELPPLQGERC